MHIMYSIINLDIKTGTPKFKSQKLHGWIKGTAWCGMQHILKYFIHQTLSPRTGIHRVHLKSSRILFAQVTTRRTVNNDNLTSLFRVSLIPNRKLLQRAFITGWLNKGEYWKIVFLWTNIEWFVLLFADLHNDLKWVKFWTRGLIFALKSIIFSKNKIFCGTIYVLTI